jgi:hypothetical protein
MWHTFRAIGVMDLRRIGPRDYGLAFGSSLPFWFAGVAWSRHVYASLPDVAPPGCFVVTAASRGHRRVVGPLYAVRRGGQTRYANQQLITFWEFESLWRAFAPRSHAFFRRCYNRFGPWLARRITSPWGADIVYLALKPAEIVARGALGRRGKCGMTNDEWEIAGSVKRET